VAITTNGCHSTCIDLDLVTYKSIWPGLNIFYYINIDERPGFFFFLKFDFFILCAVKILFLSFTFEDKDVFMVADVYNFSFNNNNNNINKTLFLSQ